MAGSVNLVILVGNLGKDPEVRSTQAGAKIVNLTLATSESWNDRASGERKEKVEWHRVTIFNEKLAELAERFLRKGSLISIEGSLQTRKYTDQQGQDRYTTEIVVGKFNGGMQMLARFGDEAGQGSSPAPKTGSWAAPSAPPSGSGRKGTAPAGDIDDEIPF